MQDDLDRLIDGALADYSSAEPLAGLEVRVINRVRATEAARKRRWRWQLALAAPVLAAIVIAVLVRKPQPPAITRVVPPRCRVETAPPPPPLAAVRHLAPRPAARTRRASAHSQLPKRATFPTLTPLTNEERLLVKLAEFHPHGLLARPAEEIEIKPIQIAPLRIDGGQ